MKNVILVILIAAMAGLGLYFYFMIGQDKTNLSDLDTEMSQISTDDTSVTLDVTVDTAGL